MVNTGWRVGCGVAAAVGLFAGCHGTLSPGVRGTVAGAERTYAYTLTGDGPVTIVFEAGLRSGFATWSAAVTRMGDSARVFVYDRAGYGGSAPSDLPRSGAQIVQELRAVLRAAGAVAPYVLVGHGLGAQYLELFARTYPDEVWGLVVVDPLEAAGCEAAAATSACERFVPSRPPAVQRDWAAAPRLRDELAAAPGWPGVPLAVVVPRGVDPPQTDGTVRYWVSRRRNRLPDRDPGPVVEAIGWVLRRAGGR